MLSIILGILAVTSIIMADPLGLSSLSDLNVKPIYHQDKTEFDKDRFISKSIVGPVYPWVSIIDPTQEVTIAADAYYKSLAVQLDRQRFTPFALSPARIQAVLDDLRINNIPPTDVTAVADALTQLLGDEILAILQDPIYQQSQQARIQADKTASFSDTKGRTSSYTQSELAILMNSAYIYVPFIQDATYKPNSMKVFSGLTWYKITVRPDNSLKIIPIVSFHAIQRILYTQDTKFDFIREKSRILGITVAKKTRSFPAFRLAGRVRSVSGRVYTLDLPQDYGQLDDVYFLKESVLSESGRLSYETVGVLRLKKKAPDTQTTLQGYQHLGASRDRGGWVVEDPRYHISASLGYYTSTYATALVDQVSGIQGDIAYNFGPSIGISQLFLGSQFKWASGQSGYDVQVQYYDFYILKKFWWRNHGLRLLGGLGRSELQLSKNTQYDLTSSILRYGLGYELMITARASLVVHWSQEIGLDRDEQLALATTAVDQLVYSGEDFDNTQLSIGISFDF